MTQVEIIEMALRSGLPSKDAANQKMWWLKAFAKLVEDAAFKRWAAQTKLAVQEEREACAKVCETLKLLGPYKEVQEATLQDAATAIRARGDA